VRYGFAEIWSSKVTAILCVACYVPAIIMMFTIYLMNNPAARLLVGGNIRVLDIDQHFFLLILKMQCWLALVLTAWIGPRLMSPDLADNALPLLLSRPISRVEYVLGKLAVLVGCLSLVTWVPALLLFLFQTYSSKVPWAGKHLFIAWGLFVGALIWILFLSLFALTLSSWVKWRVVATGAIFAGILVPAGIGVVFNAVVRTKWGFLINVPYSMASLWQRLLRIQPNAFEIRLPLPPIAILAMLLLASAACVAALNARVRAREVVRG
jgi:ABC-type transport system involved in multi-copper enzyme maturation permease subunit